MEPTSGPSKLQNVANISTIVVSVLLSVVLIKVFLLPPPRAPIGGRQLVGLNMKESLAGVDWAQNKRTLVMVLSTQCHYCTDSARFFQRIQKEAAKSMKMVAVLPQAVDDSRKYLEGEGVHVDDIKQTQLSTIGVTGTPTLLLVDGSGKVAHAWQGKLQPEQEAAVLTILKKEAL
jgi:thioredoxin-related protein